MLDHPSPSAELRRATYSSLRALAEAGADALPGHLDRLCASDVSWRVAAPMDEMAGPAAAAERIYGPLMRACPDLERRDDLFVGGSYEGRTYLAATGHYCGTFAQDWLGMPATGRALMLRYGEVWQIDGDGRVVEATLLWDVLDAMRQAGVWPLAPAMGAEIQWPAPITADGLRLAPAPADEGAVSLAQTLAMHATLGAFDESGGLDAQALIGMPQREHWHPRMMWYGPAGIGTTRGLRGFVDHHQLPFRIAFQRPRGDWEEVQRLRAEQGAKHYIRIGDGPYSVTGGWPSVYAVHRGGGFCGLPPTGREVTMRVMDFYLHHEGLIRENWVPLDMIDLLRQMGFDALGRMRELLAR